MLFSFGIVKSKSKNAVLKESPKRPLSLWVVNVKDQVMVSNLNGSFERQSCKAVPSLDNRCKRASHKILLKGSFERPFLFWIIDGKDCVIECYLKGSFERPFPLSLIVDFLPHLYSKTLRIEMIIVSFFFLFLF